MALSLTFNPISGTFDYVDGGNSVWGTPVPDYTTLSAITTDPIWSVRVVENEESAYIYNGATWDFLGKVKSANMGSSPNAQGYSLASDNTLTMQPADATHPGLVSSGTQSIGGNKTFTGTISATNLSGTNTGDVTLTAVGSSPNSNAASLSGQALTLQPANGSNPGVVTSGTQTFGGNKVFSGDVEVDGVTYAQGGVDRNTSGTLAIGTSSNTTTINIGNSGATINLQGTVITETTTTLNVTNPVFTLNHGGSAGSASNSGMQVEEASSITGYVETSGDRASWILKAPATAGTATITPGAGGITLSQSSHDPVTVSNTNSIALSLSSQLLSANNRYSDTTITEDTNGIKVGVITNSNVANAAAIAYSKLNLTASIVNADISASAGIVYSKLSLASSIINSDINGSAAIAYSKLNLTGSILNADINASAAIAYSKLALTGSVVNADIASGAAIAVSKLAALTASSAVVTDPSGVLTPSATSATQIGYLSTVTSDVQTQLNSKTTASTGDINETTFAPLNNISSAANVTGLAFANASVRSARVQYSIFINATTPLYEAGTLLLIQKGSSWEMSQTQVGDNSLLTLTVTTSGQIQYTTPSYAGFTSAKMQFRATVTGV